jgi:hypothetical protein
MPPPQKKKFIDSSICECQFFLHLSLVNNFIHADPDWNLIQIYFVCKCGTIEYKSFYISHLKYHIKFTGSIYLLFIQNRNWKYRPSLAFIVIVIYSLVITVEFFTTQFFTKLVLFMVKMNTFYWYKWSQLISIGYFFTSSLL